MLTFLTLTGQACLLANYSFNFYKMQKKKPIKNPVVIDFLWKYNKITYAKPYTQNRSYFLLIKRIFFKYPQGLGPELGYLSHGSPCYKPQALLERKHSVSPWHWQDEERSSKFRYQWVFLGKEVLELRIEGELRTSYVSICKGILHLKQSALQHGS